GAAWDLPEPSGSRFGARARAPRATARARAWLGATAALLVAAGLLAVSRPWKPRRAAPGPPPPLARPIPRGRAHNAFAMVLRLDGVRWEPGQGGVPAEGDVLPACRLRLRSGRATLSMLSGVIFVVEGPADVELTSNDRIYCHRGKLRAHVPEGAEGFLVS